MIEVSDLECKGFGLWFFLLSKRLIRLEVNGIFQDLFLNIKDVDLVEIKKYKVFINNNK